MAERVKLTGFSEVGLPQPVEVPTAELRNALLRDPSILVDVLTGVLGGGSVPSGPRGGGIVPVDRRPKVEVYPTDTPVSALLDRSQFSQLTDRAQKLTKEDLLALGGWGVEQKLPSDLGLTVDDIASVREVFSQNLGARAGAAFDPAAISVSCCCCTPCCCAAAQPEPIRLLS
jgi:hypothetical protein